MPEVFFKSLPSHIDLLALMREQWFRLFDFLAEEQHVTALTERFGPFHEVDEQYSKHKTTILSWPTSPVAATKNLLDSNPKMDNPEDENPSQAGSKKDNDENDDNDDDKKDETKDDDLSKTGSQNDEKESKQIAATKENDAMKINTGLPRSFINERAIVSEVLNSGKRVVLDEDRLTRSDSGQLIKVDNLDLFTE